MVVSLVGGGRGLAVADFLAISALHIQDPEELLLDSGSEVTLSCWEDWSTFCTLSQVQLNLHKMD